MAGEYPFINSPGSGWHDTSPSSETVSRQIRSNAKAQLLQEAASFVPDAAKLSEELMKYDISGGDRNHFVGSLNKMMTQYLTKYQENPYYAFTREGKDLVKEMQRLVNHPSLTTLQENNKRLTELQKRADDDHLTSKFNIINGKFTAFDKRSKKFVQVGRDALDSDNYVPVTVGEAIKRSRQLGFYNPDSPYNPEMPFEINMASDKDVQDFINGMLSNLGSTGGDNAMQVLKNGTQDLMNMVSTKWKTNQKQVNDKARALLSGAQMPSSFWDTLKSNAYSQLSNNGNLITEEEANARALTTLKGMLDGAVETSFSTEATPAAAHRGVKEGSSKTVDQGLYGKILNGDFGADQVIPLGQGIPNKKGSNLQDMLWGFVDNNGMEAGLAPLDMNPVIKDVRAFEQPIQTFSGTTIDPSKAMPAPNSNTFMTMGNDKIQYIVGDFLVEERGFQDGKVEGTVATDQEENHIKKLADKFYEAADKNKTLLGVSMYDEASRGWAATFHNDNYRRVRLRIPVDVANATFLWHAKLDRKDFKIDEVAVTPGIGVKDKKEQSRIEYK